MGSNASVERRAGAAAGDLLRRQSPTVGLRNSRLVSRIAWAAFLFYGAFDFGVLSCRNLPADILPGKHKYARASSRSSTLSASLLKKIESRWKASMVPESLPGHDPQTQTQMLPFVAPCHRLSAAAPFQWLRLGWRDLTRAPRLSLSYGVLLAGLGATIALLTYRFGLLALYLGLASGFVFVGPVLAMGLYSISYQLQQGRKPTLMFSLQRGRAHVRDTLVLGLCLLIILLVWARAATVMSVFRPSDAFPTWTALIPYLGIGTIVGAFFTAIVFAATAFSLPMLLDRRTDAVTAVVTSINATLRNKLALLVWGLLIAAAVLLGFVTLFLGFIVLVPLLGHSTWHAYRSTIDATQWPPTHD